jgi:multicomponent K+:H+ antiporter subunit E
MKSPKRFPLLLCLVMIAMWLLLNASLSVGQLLLGVLLTLGLLALAARMRPVRPRLVRPLLILPLIPVVLADVVRSNIGVARVVLGRTGGRPVHSGFLDIPLELRDPHGLAVLSAIITSTPGTSWAGVSPDGKWLRLHVLDLQDDQYWIDTIKQRYERPLMRIFEP